jgi:hypothetical protein
MASEHMPTAAEKGLRHPQRFITDHNSKGEAVFSNKVPEPIPFTQIPNDAQFALCYATNEYPVEFSEGKDLKTYENYLENLPGTHLLPSSNENPPKLTYQKQESSSQAALFSATSTCVPAPPRPCTAPSHLTTASFSKAK